MTIFWLFFCFFQLLSSTVLLIFKYFPTYSSLLVFQLSFNYILTTFWLFWLFLTTFWLLFYYFLTNSMDTFWLRFISFQLVFNILKYFLTIFIILFSSFLQKLPKNLPLSSCIVTINLSTTVQPKVLTKPKLSCSINSSVVSCLALGDEAWNHGWTTSTCWESNIFNWGEIHKPFGHNLSFFFWYFWPF